MRMTSARRTAACVQPARHRKTRPIRRRNTRSSLCCNLKNLACSARAFIILITPLMSQHWVFHHSSGRIHPDGLGGVCSLVTSTSCNIPPALITCRLD